MKIQSIELQTRLWDNANVGKKRQVQMRLDESIWAILQKEAADLAELEGDYRIGAATIIERILRERYLLLTSMSEDDVEFFESEKSRIEKEIADLATAPAKPTRLTLGEIELLVESSRTWHHLAAHEPAALNRVCRDLFKRVLVHRDKSVTFELHQWAVSVLD